MKTDPPPSCEEVEAASAAQASSPRPATDIAEIPERWQKHFQALLDTRRYRGRFIAIYLLLALILGSSLAGELAMSTGRWPRPRTPWSTWTPPSKRTSMQIRAIARHVAVTYRSGERGKPFVSVTASPQPVARYGPQRTDVTTISIDPTAKRKHALTPLDATKTIMYSLCGAGPRCTSPPSARGEMTVHLEALELALLTLKYVPGVNSILALPPPPRTPANRYALFFEKATLNRQLKTPLRTTLPASPPSFRNDLDPPEAARIDRLTLGHLYRYRLEQLPLGGLMLVLQRPRANESSI